MTAAPTNWDRRVQEDNNTQKIASVNLCEGLSEKNTKICGLHNI